VIGTDRCRDSRAGNQLLRSRWLAALALTMAVPATARARPERCFGDTIYYVADARFAISCRLDPSIGGCDAADIDCDNDVDLCDVQIFVCARNMPIGSSGCCTSVVCQPCNVVVDGATACEEMPAEDCASLGGTAGPGTECPVDMPLPVDAGVADAGTTDASVSARDAATGFDASWPPEDAGAPGVEDLRFDFRGAGGCACRTTGPAGEARPAVGAAISLFLAAFACARARRRRHVA
jgi:hypothetical protein